jgi:hypothetical protein
MLTGWEKDDAAMAEITIDPNRKDSLLTGLPGLRKPKRRRGIAWKK